MSGERSERSPGGAAGGEGEEQAATAQATTASPQAPASGWGTGRLPFRRDIEGLRAIALMFAFLGHAGVVWAKGGYIGVDMFFVISGFLITGLLVVEIEKTGTASVARFYAHRAKRLLPLAAFVLATVAVLSAIMFSPVRRELVAGDILAAAVYLVNWHFAAEAVDYFAAGVEGSPVLHFWSLSIEEQFYLVWPVLLLTVTWWWRKRGLSIKAAALTLITIMGVASLIYSVYYSNAVPNAAYYSTFTRIYEVAIGAGLAVLALRPRQSRIWPVVSAVGLATLFIYVLTMDETVAYPSWLGLIPSIAVFSIILAGAQRDRQPLPNRIISRQPFVYIGRISYGWYMWHWPAIVFAEVQWGPLTVEQRLLAIAVAGVPTVLTHHFFENPIRYSQVLKVNPRKALAVGFGCMAVALSAAAALVITQPPLPTVPQSQVAGAAAVGAPPLGADDEERERIARNSSVAPQRQADAVRPDPIAATDDKSQMWHDGCQIDPEVTESPPCIYGDPDSNVTVVLTGDSHALHYFPAVEAIAQKRGWRLLALTKVGCSPYEQMIYNPKLGREYRECLEWQDNIIERLNEERPNMVIMSGGNRVTAMEDGERLHPTSERNRELLEDGFYQYAERMRHTGARVVIVKDNPYSPHDIPECVSEQLGPDGDLRECAFHPDEAIEGTHDEQAFEVNVAERVPGATLVDLEDAFCPGPDRLCHAVIGDALVMRDGNHFTGTFARTMAGRLDELLPRPN